MWQRLFPSLQLKPAQWFITTVLITTALWSATADAIDFFLFNNASTRLNIRVGSAGNTINEVAFTVPAAQLGDGTPVNGSQQIRMSIRIRARGFFPQVASLTVDSLSNPLTNTTAGSTSTIPFSEISWTSRDGVIPSGTYNGTMNQPIGNFRSSRRYRDTHNFSYANSLALEAGTYEGRVTYTFAVP